jgi:aldehyde dehydrogenase (NAD+)
VNQFQTLFDSHKAYQHQHHQIIPVANRATRSARASTYRESTSASNRVCEDFKTATDESLFEVTAPLGVIAGGKNQLADWMRPVEPVLPKFLRDSGHKGVIYREPYSS